jgi:hypothetical protein
MDKVKSRIRNSDIFLERSFVSHLFRRNSFIVVFFISGFFGFFAGIRYATPQYVLEAAQIISGVVSYPEPTIWSLLVSRIWCILSQICAIFLRLGVSELILSYLVSGLLAMLSFQGLSLVVLALSGNLLLSIATPLIVVLTGAYNFGIIYPVTFIHPSTYGVLGLSYTLLVVVIISNKRYRLGAFLLGLAPATQAVLGMSLWLVVGINLLCDFKALRSHLSQSSKYFLFGCLILIFSISFYALTVPSLPQVPREISSRYLETFVQGWETHRSPVDFSSVGMFLNITGFAISLFWLKSFKDEIPVNVRFLLRSFMLFAFLGILFSVLTWLQLKYVPDIIISAMPQRIINFNILGFVPLLIGLFGRYRDDSRIQLGLMVITIILFLVGLGLLQNPSLFVVMFGGSVALVFLKLLTKFKISYSEKNRTANLIPKANKLLLVVLIVTFTIYIYSATFKDIKYKIPDRTNFKFWNVVSKGEGILLIPMIDWYFQPMTWTQLITRRQILLNPDKMDIVAYVPCMGPELDKILKKVYGLEFTKPPSISVAELNKVVWETRSIEKWRDIRKEFGATEILTIKEWTLQLPVKARDSLYILYEIPLEK